MEDKNIRRENTARRQRSKQPDDVVYTEPKPFLRRRFILHMATVLAVVVALILGMSLFFKVETVTVAGMEKYSAWDVRQASGISDGENLLSISKAKISDSIIAIKRIVTRYIRFPLILPSAGSVNRFKNSIP